MRVPREAPLPVVADDERGWMGFGVCFGVGLVGSAFWLAALVRLDEGAFLALTALVVACLGTAAILMPSQTPTGPRRIFRVAAGFLAFFALALWGAATSPSSGDPFGDLAGGVALLVISSLFWATLVFIGSGLLLSEASARWRRRRATRERRRVEFTIVRR